ncbi:Lumazine-binding domain [Mycobacteroides abscessus subsp. abscessus]|nr:Lumazine-binding domain [Mycobacteroides abscessus subsp. abscessus]
MEALSKGDAEAALSYSADQPASKEFLTDDILKKQIAQWPVGNIRILNSEDMGGVMARVHVAANFGDQTSDETILVKKTDGSWKLSTAAVKLSLDQNGILAGALRTLSLFGKPASNMSVAYVFPGWLDIGSANKNLTAVSARPVLLNGILVQGAPVFPGIEMRMSEEGAAAVKKAVVDNIAECAKSTSLAPPGCPQALRNPAYVDGTARWEPPSDVDKVQYTFTAFDLTVRTTGVTTWMLTVQSTNGSTVQGRAIVPTMGQIDMTQDPLVVKWFGR